MAVGTCDDFFRDQRQTPDRTSVLTERLGGLLRSVRMAEVHGISLLWIPGAGATEKDVKEMIAEQIAYLTGKGGEDE